MDENVGTGPPSIDGHATDAPLTTSDTSNGLAKVLAKSADRYRFPPFWDARLLLVTESLFMAGFQRGAVFFDAAVRDAALHLESRLRELCDAPLDEIGVDLVEYAFGKTKGKLTNHALPESEREGMRLLFRGAVQQIRNPLGHRHVMMPPEIAFGSIAVVDHLLRVANAAALEKLVYPFVTRRERARIITATKRLDVAGDEIFVVVVGHSDEDGQWSEVLVLRGDPLTPVAGDLPAIDGAVAPTVEATDLDGRSDIHIVVSAADPSRMYHAIVIAIDGGEATGTIGPADHPLTSFERPFEIIRPMALGGRPVIAAYAPDNSVTYWSYQEGSLLPLSDLA